MTETLTIERLGHRGEGVATRDGKPVFVPLTLPGETITAEIEGNRGQLIDILAPSPDRQPAPCPHFGACGGCQLQHLAPPAYRAFKRQLVVDALARAGVAAEVADPIMAHGAGRRRATLHAAGALSGKVADFSGSTAQPRKSNAAGFMALRSHDIHDLDRCPILVPALGPAPDIARAIAATLGPCDVAFTATDMGLDIAIRAKGAKPNARLTAIARQFDLARLSLNGEPLIVHRPPSVTMGPSSVPVPVSSFLQATAAAETILADLVLDAVKGRKKIADLFCGVGPFALRLARNAPVFAADSDAPALAALDAARRATMGLKPITAQRRDLFREPLVDFELKRFDAVVLDPPRAGAEAQIRELAASKVKTIAYVSCDPQSFARDAAALIAGGYAISRVTPVDQFVFSAHIELFAVFDRL